MTREDALEEIRQAAKARRSAAWIVRGVRGGGTRRDSAPIRAEPRASCASRWGIQRIPVGHPEGYDPVAVWRGAGCWIGAGCWFFPLAEAWEHWGPSHEGERWLGNRYLKALDILEAEAQFWLEKWDAEKPLES